MISSTRILTLSLLIAAILLLPAASNPPPILASDETLRELSLALSHRLQAEQEIHSLTLDLFTPELDTAFTSPDGETAVLWLALRDDTGRLLATEPGLALARMTVNGWQVLLPGDQGWEELLTSLPEGMLPLELSPAPDEAALAPNAITAPLSGYYLPYAAGTSRWLEGSISHFQYIPELGYPSCSQEYCRYAYDFTDAAHYPLVASKGGTVVGSRDICSDGNPNCTNYIVLYNANDQAYQIYLHLAYGTIPNKLTPGTAVLKGQYLGDSDDTGYSTSQHVHFMVTTSIWLGGDGYFWGRSIDIRFADVAINNGIPRTCYEVTHFPIYDGATECLGTKADPRNPVNDWFTSGNVGAYPPTGALSRPTAGATVTSEVNPLMDVTATASDDVRVAAVRLVAKLNNQWVEIGPKLPGPGPFDWDVNLCDEAPVNGSLEVALRVWDHEGNVATALDARTIQVDHACPPPSSQLMPAEGFKSTAVHLSWEATSAGAGIDSFELQWRLEPGAWEAANTLTMPGEARAAWFAGQAGSKYGFRLRALDANNQPEPWPAGETSETSITLPETCDQDSFEPDDDQTQAKTQALDLWELRNLCGQSDQDWFKVKLADATDYFVIARSQSGGAAVAISVYAVDGQTILTSGQAAGLGQDTIIQFSALTAGDYYIKIEPLMPYLMGTDAVYTVTVTDVKKVFLPLATR